LGLQIEQQENENRELELTVRVDEPRVAEAMRETAKKLTKTLRIRGFRPGKAPYHVVQRWVGKDTLRAEAVESIAPDVFREAIEQVDVVPYAPGSIDDMEMDPLVFRITVPLEPTVDLGDYRQVSIDLPEISVTDEQVNQAMKAIQERHALLEPADRPVQEGDVIIADLKAEKDGEVLLEREGAELLVDAETLYQGTPFVENVVGMSAGDERTFDIASAKGEDDEDDDQDGAVTHTVAVQEVKSRYLPPLNDDLAKEEGDYETLLELRIDVRKQLTEAAQKQADARYADQVFEKIQEGATVAYPPAAVELELDTMVEDLKQSVQRQGWDMEEYLRVQGQTIETTREQSKTSAEQRVKGHQVTLALVRAEQLGVDDAELEQRVDERLGQLGEQEDGVIDQLRERYMSERGRMVIINDVLSGKLSERLRAIGRGEAPDLEGSEEEE